MKVHQRPATFATQNIFDLMETFEQSACVSAHDTTYALSGLASNIEIRSVGRSSLPGRAAIIPLDARYDVDCPVVYRLFATSAISCEYGFDILRAACDCMSDFDRSALPNWVPDWT